MALIEPLLNPTQATQKDDIARRFSVAASQYDRVANIQAEIASATLARVSSVTVAKALDIGCGTGRHTYQLSRLGGETTGLDLAAGMVSQARQNYPGLHFIQGDAEQLPWQAETFDLIVSTMALQWCRRPQAPLAEVHRVLNGGGRAELAIMVDGSFAELREASRQTGVKLHINNLFTASDWLTAVSQSGLICKAHDLTGYTDQFAGLLELLRSIKDVGAGSGNLSSHRQGLTRRHLKQLESVMPRSGQGLLTNTYSVLHLTLEKAL